MNYQGYFVSNLKKVSFILNGIYDTYLFENNFLNHDDIVNEKYCPVFSEGNVFHRISNVEITDIINEFIKFTSNMDTKFKLINGIFEYKNKILEFIYNDEIPNNNIILTDECNYSKCINIYDYNKYEYGFYIYDKNSNVLEAIGLYI